MPIKFAKLTKIEAALLEVAADRAEQMYEKHGRDWDRVSFIMDMEATHARIPLDFDKLTQMDDFNFAHDVYGIERHMNRETGRIENCFLPRCAAPYRKKDSPERIKAIARGRRIVAESRKQGRQ